MKLLKVLQNDNGRLVSPFQDYEYQIGRKYICPEFDLDKNKDCSYGYYATEIDGIIYSFRNLPGYEVYECEVGGRSVEYDQFKRRYEMLELIKRVPYDELKGMAEEAEPRVGYKLAEALFPVHPLLIPRNGALTNGELELLKQWASVGASVWASVRASVWASVRASVWDSVRDSVWDSVGAYISSLFPNIKKWKYIDRAPGLNPFQLCIDLWCAGIVPSYDGTTWKLHSGKKAEIIWEGKI
jgi:hypothetical protein